MKTGPLNGSITTYTLVSASANKEDIRTAKLNTLTMKIYSCDDDGIEYRSVFIVHAFIAFNTNETKLYFSHQR